MIDFSGWRANVEWRGYSYGEPPAWLPYILAVPAIAGVACVALSWTGVGHNFIWPVAALIAALVIEFISRDGFDEASALIVSYEVSAIFAGALALVALRLEESTARLEFAVVAPSLVFGCGIATSRAIAATLFSVEMVQFVKEKAELIRASLAGELDALVVRLETIEGDELTLSTVGEARGQNLVATRDVLGLRRTPISGVHFLVEAPTLGERETSDYRGRAARRRVIATTKSHYLGPEATTLAPSAYWDEVRAGIVVILAEHSILGGAAWLIANAIR